VKQSDLGEYEENAREKQKIQIYKIRHQLSLKPSHKDAKHQSPLQISKARSIEGFGEDIRQLSLGINVFHLNISLLNMMSQEVVSSRGVPFSCGRLDFWLQRWHYCYRT
jgi:hypothetical protein